MSVLLAVDSAKSLDRVVITGLPAPSLPSFSVKMGSERLLSAASLLQQLIPLERVPLAKKRITQQALQSRLNRWANEFRTHISVDSEYRRR